jgi:hypothetical protein
LVYCSGFTKGSIIANAIEIYENRGGLVNDNNDKPLLSELELIEHELWFINYPKAAELLAAEIFNLISSK